MSQFENSLRELTGAVQHQQGSFGVPDASQFRTKRIYSAITPNSANSDNSTAYTGSQFNMQLQQQHLQSIYQQDQQTILGDSLPHFNQGSFIVTDAVAAVNNAITQLQHQQNIQQPKIIPQHQQLHHPHMNNQFQSSKQLATRARVISAHQLNSNNYGKKAEKGGYLLNSGFSRAHCQTEDSLQIEDEIPPNASNVCEEELESQQEQEQQQDSFILYNLHNANQPKQMFVIEEQDQRDEENNIKPQDGSQISGFLNSHLSMSQHQQYQPSYYNSTSNINNSYWQNSTLARQQEETMQKQFENCKLAQESYHESVSSHRLDAYPDNQSEIFLQPKQTFFNDENAYPEEVYMRQQLMSLNKMSAASQVQTNKNPVLMRQKERSLTYTGASTIRSQAQLASPLKNNWNIEGSIQNRENEFQQPIQDEEQMIVMECTNSEKKQPSKLSIPINHQHTKTFSTNQNMHTNKLTLNSQRTTKNTNNTIAATRLNTIAMSTAATGITPITSRVGRMTPGQLKLQREFDGAVAKSKKTKCYLDILKKHLRTDQTFQQGFQEAQRIAAKTGVNQTGQCNQNTTNTSCNGNPKPPHKNASPTKRLSNIYKTVGGKTGDISAARDAGDHGDGHSQLGNKSCTDNYIEKDISRQSIKQKKTIEKPRVQQAPLQNKLHNLLQSTKAPLYPLQRYSKKEGFEK